MTEKVVFKRANNTAIGWSLSYTNDANGVTENVDCLYHDRKLVFKNTQKDETLVLEFGQDRKLVSANRVQRRNRVLTSKVFNEDTHTIITRQANNDPHSKEVLTMSYDEHGVLQGRNHPESEEINYHELFDENQFMVKLQETLNRQEPSDEFSSNANAVKLKKDLFKCLSLNTVIAIA